MFTSKCLDISLTLHHFCHVARHCHVARILDWKLIWTSSSSDVSKYSNVGEELTLICIEQLLRKSVRFFNCFAPSFVVLPCIGSITFAANKCDDDALDLASQVALVPSSLLHKSFQGFVERSLFTWKLYCISFSFSVSVFLYWSKTPFLYAKKFIMFFIASMQSLGRLLDTHVYLEPTP